MRILFHVNLRTMLRHFESVILALADRGHTIRIASTVNRKDVDPPAVLLNRPGIEFVEAPEGRSDQWAARIGQLRVFRDYLRYLERRFDRAPKLRARAVRKLAQEMTDEQRTHLVAFCPQCNGRLVDDDVGVIFRTGLSKKGFNNLRGVLALMEETIPSDPSIEAFLRAEQPDVLVITPLIKIGSVQPEFVKSAKALDIPVAYPVFSWDNLSTKGIIHVQPDTVLVWNERQRTEAIEMHEVPADRVVVTGAPRFDDFFAMTARTSRVEFCAEYGFDANQAIISYLCSSEFVTGHEFEFVQRWVDHIRRTAPLRNVNLLIRPHPRQQKPWKRFTSPWPRVAVSMPKAMNADQTLFDTVHHSDAVVGLNTSAELEAGIVGRPVFTVLVPEFAEGQQGTLHFDYLLKEHGGFVEVASDLETHCQQLADAAAGRYDAEGIRTFVQTFLRPLGLDRPATAACVEAIEATAARAPRPSLSYAHHS